MSEARHLERAHYVDCTVREAIVSRAQRLRTMCYRYLGVSAHQKQKDYPILPNTPLASSPEETQQCSECQGRTISRQ